MLKLFYGAGACSLASHITLEEIGQAYETYSVNMAKGEHKSPEYLKINPRGKVPALQIDDQFLIENVAIQNYLVKHFPEAGLAPKDPLGESRWLSVNAWRFGADSAPLLLRGFAASSSEVSLPLSPAIGTIRSALS